MVDYQSDELFPFPRERVWKLLHDHTDDSLIGRIHPLIRQQRTVSRSDDSAVVDRSIEARGRLLTSQWKYTFRRPDRLKWEITGGTGPYAPGSWLENTYIEDAGGTRIRSRGQFRITVVPFFIPQRTVVTRVLDTIDAEDQDYLRG
jgi:hypothetical protein